MFAKKQASTGTDSSFPKTHAHEISRDYEIKEAFPSIISIFNITAPLGWAVQLQSWVHIYYFKKGSLLISKQIGTETTKMM